jgi:hypothetical protein
MRTKNELQLRMERASAWNFSPVLVALDVPVDTASKVPAPARMVMSVGGGLTTRRSRITISALKILLLISLVTALVRNLILHKLNLIMVSWSRRANMVFVTAEYV